MTPRLIPVATALALLMSPVHAHDAPRSEIAAAATQFLDSLDAPQRAKAAFPFTSDERESWHYVPRVRGGVSMKVLGAGSRERARGLLKAALSQRGLATVDAIIALEDVLREMEQSAHRDPALYYVAIFGTPGADPWGWRFEGHHVSLNYTFVGGHGAISSTPTFMGANPAEVRIGAHKGKRALAAEEDLGRKLVASLSTDQLKVARISTRAPAEILTGADSRVDPLDHAGIAVSEMSADQQTQLVALLKYYLHRHRAEIAHAAFAKIEAAGIEKLRFAWAGGLEVGDPHYYRIQGTTFVVEYDNTQNGANHIHTVWRDFDGDFGRDLLREHLERDHGVAQE
ncbi:MAG TPA: DUF3500 domain-containing protein [Opitutaceae bacterium]|nr:DUF3500 domain-containing protein [Opitutaceae bacterium]